MVLTHVFSADARSRKINVLYTSPDAVSGMTTGEISIDQKEKLSNVSTQLKENGARGFCFVLYKIYCSSRLQ
jgi:hypothetical protein